jgi:Protein of unknown function (DUF3307)
MSHELALVFVGLAIFQLKHFVCDYLLQTSFQYINKGTYGHPGGILHAGIHAVGSLPAILIFTPSLGVIAAIVIGEGIVHYHIDWLKQNIDQRMNWTPEDASYWHIFGADQLLHQLTYVVILGVLVSGL